MTYLKNDPYHPNQFPQFADVKERIGFVPNFYVAQTARPDLINAEMELMAGLLLREGALPRRQKEYIFLVCSAANLSTYCVTAHCEIVRMLKLEGPEPEQIALDYAHSKISIPDKALLNFCSKLNNKPLDFNATDVESLRTFGFTEAQILEAVLLTGFAKFANAVGFGLGTVPDFHNVEIKRALEGSATVL
jgi:uncharacterized peroxidase-related enzyme